ncbi:KAP family P-loop NTPase fold protein [Anaerocolumna sp. MB42-C2]|uniref:KAP family P-loop NTPase fold protein n=1 Tax=Anaerocolumna sp. MB42-C2 TaxID=3070997 RepID=UPI0027DFCDBF|nr:P-loop NTPase fold protein [Anaerocolumna sp. MB42-C2]WMJ88902.1 P-loop NTPase fold protein [Anaerocolumna sp. MB42-C2]
MKKFELSVTEENLLNTLEIDCIGRNQEIADFLMILDGIDGSVNISLDSNWGNGKTFFVKQLELLLNYYRNNTNSRIRQIVKNSNYLKYLEMKKTFIPIYYDSWLYDDHNDPLLSIIFSIIKSGYGNDDAVKISKAKEKIASLATSLVSFTGININFEKLIEKPETYIKSVLIEEEIKSILKSIFNDIITEHTQKLLIIIDELDRCRPDYAVKLLEKVKHFFDDERVIFLFATNKEQLVHTIKNFYGYHFDGTTYLNRFFDFQFSLKDINVDDYIKFIDPYSNSEKYFQKIMGEIGNYYKFSIRDYNIYYQKIFKMTGDINSMENSGLSYLLQVFGPIILALSIKDVEKARLFLNGKLRTELENLLRESSIINSYTLRVISRESDENKKLGIILSTYDFMFKANSNYKYNLDRILIDNYDKNMFFKIINLT